MRRAYRLIAMLQCMLCILRRARLYCGRYVAGLSRFVNRLILMLLFSRTRFRFAGRFRLDTRARALWFCRLDRSSINVIMFLVMFRLLSSRLRFRLYRLFWVGH